MTPSTEFIEGLKILEPFIFNYGFKVDNIKTEQASGGQFTNATYTNGKKKLVIGYRYSIGELYYQFDNFKVGHTFYLDHLGFADKKQFPDFQSEDKLLAFKHILHDLDFILGDFFKGQCTKLIEASKLQDKFVKEHNEKAQEEYNKHFDKVTIERARQKFKDKEYKKTLELYATVEHKNLLNELDKKIIAYCERQT